MAENEGPLDRDALRKLRKAALREGLDVNVDKLGQARERPATTVLKLDEKTRKRMLDELGIEGDLSHIPEAIKIVRVRHEELGIRPAVFGTGDVDGRVFIIVDA